MDMKKSTVQMARELVERYSLDTVNVSDFENSCPHSMSMIKGSTRNLREASEWRFIGYLIHMKVTGFKTGCLSSAAKYFGRTNHATVINGVKNMWFGYNELDDRIKEYVKVIKDYSEKREKHRESVATAINRLFECRDMQDVESLKAFVNDNINPNMLR